jgi:uncharacterized membrane protein
MFRFSWRRGALLALLAFILAMLIVVDVMLRATSPSGDGIIANLFSLLGTFGFPLIVAIMGGMVLAASIFEIFTSKSVRRFTGTLVGADQGETTGPTKTAADIDAISVKIEAILDKFDAAFVPGKTDAVLSQKTEQEIMGYYREALSKEHAPEIAEEVRKLVAAQVTRETEGVAAQFLTDVHLRLRAASTTSGLRGIINLGIGISFAVFALVVLYGGVSQMTPEILNTLSMSATFYLIAARLSLVVVVTLIAYFFLALYKKSLDDTKFYQNEMTDISAHSVALQVAYFQGDPESRNAVLSRLVQSDRNRSTAPIVAAGIDEKTVTEIVKAVIDKLPKVGAGG